MALLITQGEHSRREGKMGSLVDTEMLEAHKPGHYRCQ